MEEIKTEQTETLTETQAENTEEAPVRVGRGGARARAGRRRFAEADKKVSMGIRLPLDVYSFLQLQPNKSTFVEDLIRKHCKDNGISLV